MLSTADDDDFFTPITSSSLAGLFGGAGSKESEARSLIYTAPKQPKSEGESTRVVNKLICVKTIRLFKVVNEASQYLGKYGLAIIGDDVVKSHNLIIYKTKQNIVSTTKVTSSLHFVQQNTQFLFKDDQNQSWCVEFEEGKDQAEFSQELAKIGVMVRAPVGQKKMGDSPEAATDECCFSDGTRTQARVDILNRISKVGQSMLPGALARGGDISESESDEVVKTKKVVRKPKRHSASDKETLLALNTDIPETNQAQYVIPTSPNMLQPYQYIPNQMMQCIPAQVMPLSDPFSIYFAENRTHNSEVRMNLSHLSNRLENVLSELTHIKKEKADETTGVLFRKIEELEKKLGNNPVIPDENKQVNNTDTIIDKLRAENEELRVLNSSNAELSRVNEELSSRLGELEEFQLVCKNNEVDLLNQIQALNSQVAQLNDKYKSLSLQNEALRDEKVGVSQELEAFKRTREDRLKTFGDLVKEKMNGMYQGIIEKFIDCEAITGNQVKRELSVHMKRTTFDIIEACRETFKDDTDASAPPVPEFEVTV